MQDNKLNLIPKNISGLRYKLFNLAREKLAVELKSGRKMTDVELNTFFDDWYNPVAEHFGELLQESRDALFFEFRHFISRVNQPAGANEIVDKAWGMANSQDIPDVALRYKDKKVQLFVSLCYYVQQLSPSPDWFISSRKAASLLGITRSAAANWFSVLVLDGVLIKTQSHSAYTCARYILTN